MQQWNEFSLGRGKKMNFGNGTVCVNWEKGSISSLKYKDRELLGEGQPLFSMRLRDAHGKAVLLSAEETACKRVGDGAEYRFENGVTVRVTAIAQGEKLIWKASFSAPSELIPEYIDFPGVKIQGQLLENGGDGSVLWPYNEGGLVTNGDLKTSMDDPEYPSKGSYAMFPYMLCSQFMAYGFGENGLYMGVEDASRGPKGLDFACDAEGTLFRIRIFVGGITETPPVVWQFYQGNWMDGTAIYKDWFETHLPEGLKRIMENPDLPAWYREMPIVLTYPVRGIHDMDKMEPNKLFPYDNVLPLVDEFAEKMHTKIMVLLMHWEGTAPWAPPFVWPPYGGEEMLLSFMDKLHKDGHLLGVYCSGLGWTEQSNLIAEYNTEKRFHEGHLEEAMCLSPEGTLPHSRICTGQRSGYDICPASKKGKAILLEALTPLFDASLDYMQVMDQNHGGSMYFCYSREHGHPAAPGPWMTKTMQDLTAAWKNACPNGLLGCESAAAEPYLGNLALSDNRYELNYVYGRAVPLHSFLYHEYLHNFMGNQVAAPFAYDTEGICYRLAYSFAAGDLLTLVLNDDGEIMFHWGMRDFSHHSDTERILAFCKSLHEAQRKYPQFLSDGRMVKPLSYTCEQTAIALTGKQKSIFEPSVLACAYEAANGEKMQFFVNYTDQDASVTVEDKTLAVPALSYLDYRI